MNEESFYQLGMAYHHAGQADAVKRVVLRLVALSRSAPKHWSKILAVAISRFDSRTPSESRRWRDGKYQNGRPDSSIEPGRGSPPI
jgi:hypothetical protein